MTTPQQWDPAGRARLRKYVVTENVTTTVPVSHEEIRLHAERPVVAKETCARSSPTCRWSSWPSSSS
jgi:hypothetical protein